MQHSKLDLRKTSHPSDDTSASSKGIFSGGGDPVGSSTSEKWFMDGDSVSEGVGILRKSSQSGFTIIELLLVISIMTIIGAVFLPVSIDYQQRNDLDVATTTFAQSVRRAQQMSMSGEGDSQWGVNMITGNIVIFKGNTYASRDINFDENYSISTSIANSGQTEYDFAKTTGAPAQVGIVTFVNGSYQKTVSVNAYGIVNY